METNRPTAETVPTFVARGLVCPHCRAFNGRSRCGCAKARAERGEKVQEVNPDHIVIW